MENKKWDTSNCRCNGACDIVNRSSKRPWTAPSVLSEIDALHEVDETNLAVWERRANCVSQCLCTDCHFAFSGDRGTDHGIGAPQPAHTFTGL
jgi:hypothetical protein